MVPIFIFSDLSFLDIRASQMLLCFLSEHFVYTVLSKKLCTVLVFMCYH